MGKLLSRNSAFLKGPYDRLIALVADEIDLFGSVTLLVLLGASAHDLSVVGFMTPTGAPISQSDLLNLWLSSVSLSLTAVVHSIAYIQHPRRRIEHLENGVSTRKSCTTDRDATYQSSSVSPLQAHPRWAELPGS